MPLFLGLDGGGTKTLCLVAGADGQLLGSGAGGGANPNLVGDAAACESVRLAVTRAWEGARAALAASGRAGEDQTVHAVISGPTPGQATTIVQQVTGAPALVRISESDAAWASVRPALARVGTLPLDVGITIGAGTGSTATGRGPGGERVTVGGWGWLLGDEGGGFWISLQAVQAAIQGEDGRGAPTALAGAIRRELGLSRLWELVPIVYRGAEGRQRIAALAPTVVAVARAGDPVACEVLARAGTALAAMVAAVIARLEIGAQAFAVVPFGSVFKAGALLRAPFEAGVRAAAPRAVPVYPRYESVAGTLASAMAQGGVGVERVWPTLEVGLAAHPRIVVATGEAPGDRARVPAFRDAHPAPAPGS